MAPVVIAAKNSSVIQAYFCMTGQHQEIADDVLVNFDLRPDINFRIMQPGQSLQHIHSEIYKCFNNLIKTQNPDLVVVHGDTLTAFSAALAAFHSGIKIAHVEAGLRTESKYSPFPEEANRRLISTISDIHFAPTELNRSNLVAENIPNEEIFVVGNTVIDALYKALEIKRASDFGAPFDAFLKPNYSRKLVLVTCHRTENQGSRLEELCDLLNEFSLNNPDYDLIFPVHPNPKIRNMVERQLKLNSNIYLVEPVNYHLMCHLMKKSQFIITDSGGLQEEGPALLKPVFVYRSETERKEALEAGTIKMLKGTKNEMSVQLGQMTKTSNYNKFFQKANPYGDGTAATKIIKIIEKEYIK